MVAAVLVMILAEVATAQGGLTGAMDRQRQDVTTQQGEVRREMERQGGNLQQQQERSLQFQLLQRQQPVPPPVPPNCSQVGGKLACQ
jgi:hypothetical protein